MPRYVIDLHNHTPYVATDYKRPETTPDEYVRAAAAAGIHVLGVTDHCSVSYFHRLRDAASRAGDGLLLLPGAELKVRWGGDETHLVALFDPAEFEERFAELQDALGVDLEQGVDRLPWIVLEQDPVAVVATVRSLGGLCHVAHADRWFGEYRLLGRPLLERLVQEAPVSAVELLDLANADAIPSDGTPLTFIRSSDSHSPDELGRRTATVEMRELSFGALREALFAGRA